MQSRGVIIHRQDAVILEQLRQYAFGDFAILQHIGDTRRYSQVVFQYVKLAVLIAHQIRAADMSLCTIARRHSGALGFKITRIEHDISRDDTIGENFLFVVNVVNEPIKGATALY